MMKFVIFKNKFFIIFYFLINLLSLICKNIGIFFIYLSLKALDSGAEIWFFYYFLIIISLIAFSLLIDYFLKLLKIKNVQKNIIYFKNNISRRIVDFDYYDLEKNKSGKFISWFTKDCSIIEENLNIFYSYIGNFLGIVINLAFLFYFSWMIGLSVLFFSILIGIFVILFGSQFQKLVNYISQFNEKYNSSLFGMFSNFNTFLFSNKKDVFVKKLNSFSNDFYLKEINIIKKIVYISSIISISMILSQSLVLFLAVLLSSLEIISYLYIASIFVYGLTVYSYISDVLNTMSGFLGALSIYKKHNFVMENKKEIKNNKEIPAYSFTNFKFQNVNFKYDNKEVFADLNINFEKNKKYAIVGKSGSGKSTLIKLLSKIENPESGKLLLNNNEYEKEDFFKLTTIINSSNYVFDDSIINNITLWKETNSEDLKKAEEILKDLKLFKDLKYLINKNSLNISEGEKQRICLARHFFYEKQILILDESLSNLDINNRKIILDYLLSKENLTLIFVSHHLTQNDKKHFDEVIELREEKNV